MKKFITAALLAAVAMPSVAISAPASAQSREQRRDNDVRRDDRRDTRRDDRREVRRDDRRDTRNHRQNYRQDRNRNWGANDWQRYRQDNRRTFSRGNWNAPFRYNSFGVGGRIGSNYYGSRYVIADPWRYRLAQPGRFQQWVRHYDDLLLVDTRRGRVIRVIRNFYW